MGHVITTPHLARHGIVSLCKKEALLLQRNCTTCLSVVIEQVQIIPLHLYVCINSSDDQDISDINLVGF